MDEVFMKNYKKHSEYLVWQYIGTPQGVMRTYPAMSLYPLSRTNFDVRKRPWYNAGIGCPKDVVVLVDISGSMDGRPSVLMKAIFKRLVEQIISDMDYIAAVKVGDKPVFLTCHTRLMRATKQTKNLMYREIEKLSVGGTAMWESGLNLAFQTLDTQLNTAQCEKAVVIMSDEITQPVDEIVARLDPEKRVRVYSLSFRRNEAFFRDRMKSTACNHRGNYNKILSYGDIDSALQEIVKTGNEPLKGQNITPTWSNAYKDLGEVGMVVTATLPLVVDTSPSQRSVTRTSPVTFLGIVGLDFKATRIVRISGSVLPVQCTLMILNNKGYPIYHPRISQYSYERVNTRLNKFQYTTENNQDFYELEKVMIDKGLVVRKFPTFLNAELFNTLELDQGVDPHEPSHRLQHGRDWYQDLVFQVFPLHQTPLSMAVIWTSYPQKYYMYKWGSISIPTINSIIAWWGDRMYYDFRENACKINEVLDSRSGDRAVWNRTDTCSTFVFSVLTDVFLSQSLSGHFFPSHEVNITNHYLITYSGLIFFSNASWKQDPEIQRTFKEFYHFKKSSRNLDEVDIFLTLPVRKLDSAVIFLIKPLKMKTQENTGNTSTQISALGLEVDLDSLRGFLFPGREREERRLLVDENGMIVLSSLGDKSGFLGSCYPSLFRTLYRKGIYQRIDYQECIHTCEVVIHTKPRAPANSAFRLYRSFWSLLRELFRLMVACLLHQVTETVHNNIYTTMDCCKEYTQYQKNGTFQKFSVESWCNGCLSQITVSDVSKTNLILITDHTPNCTCNSRKVDLEGGIISDREGVAACIPLEGEESRNEDYYVSFQSCVLGNYSSSVCSGAMRHSGIENCHHIWAFIAISVILSVES